MKVNEITKRILINEHTSFPMEFFYNPLWTQKRKFSEYEAWMLLLVDAVPIVENVFINGKYNRIVVGITYKYIGYYTRVLQWNKSEVNKFFKYLLDENAITKDKWMHFGISMIIAYFSLYYTPIIVLPFIFGLLKELSDK